MQKFDDDFGVHHPVFHWIWKASHDWDSVADLIPKMRTHLRRHDPSLAKVTPLSSSASSVHEDESCTDSTVLFREGYCVAAADLAERLYSSLDQLGALYDQVIGTGLLPTLAKRPGSASAEGSSPNSPTTFEKGQLLLFTRKLRPEETDHFTAAGFRFAPSNRVEGTIAKTMQVPVSHVVAQMARLHSYAQRTSVAPPPKQGVFLVCLAALARVRSTFLVLVQKDKQEELPDAQLVSEDLTTYQLSYLNQFDGWLAERFIKTIEWKDKNRNTLANEEKTFVLILRNALAHLAETLGEEWFLDLVFSSQPIYMRYGASKAQVTAHTTVFGFTRMVDIHQGTRKCPEQLTLANWEFVKLRQVYYPGCNDHGKMRHEVHAEFGPLLEKHEATKPIEERRQSIVKSAISRSAFLRRNQSVISNDSDTMIMDSCSERGLVEIEEGRSFETSSIYGSPKQLWGGILATTDTVVVETSHKNGAMEMSDMGPHVTATAVSKRQGPRSFIDILYAQAKAYSSQTSRSTSL